MHRQRVASDRGAFLGRRESAGPASIPIARPYPGNADCQQKRLQQAIRGYVVM
jgi:hypothetical protein